MDVRYLDGVIGDLVKYFLWMLTQRNDVRTWTQSYLSGAFGPSRDALFEGAQSPLKWLQSSRVL